ncbi:MAG: tetratricopeptide repeat protein [Planctomycetota bacterium]
MFRTTTLILAALALSLPGAPLHAQGGRGDFAAELEQAADALAKGRRERARAVWEDLLVLVDEGEDEAPSKVEQAECWRGLARLHEDGGRYREALEALAKAQALAASPRAVLAEVRVRSRLGEYEQALTLADGLAKDDDEGTSVEASWLGGRLRWVMGRREEARRAFEAIEDRHARQNLRDPRALLCLSRALIALQGRERLFGASRILVDLSKADPHLAEAYVALGDLNNAVYREAAGYPSGESEYKRALQECGEVEDALLGLYASRKDNYLLDPGKTDAYLRRALALNPRSVRGLVLKASTSIDDRDFDGARALLDAALAVNPRAPEALAESAALSRLTYRHGDEKAFRERLAGVDPGSTRPDVLLGKHLVALYRFQEAIGPLRAARAERGDDYECLLTLGKALLHAGEGEAAREVLLASRALEPGWIDPWRENQLFLQKRIDDSYDKIEDGSFVYVLHPDEKDVLHPYLKSVYETAWRELGTKYGIHPDCKVRVECFERFGDFSVRTIGFKGFGALGACFGCLITSVSPSAPELRSQFSWRVTARHEYSHVLHLALSKGRVPRWLTEGIAVLEEVALDPSNDRRMERELYTAWRNGDVFPLSRLNSAFRTSKILFGYYQGGLIARFLAEKYGFEKLVDLVKAYAEDKSTEQIFEEVLGIDAKEFDRLFLAHVEGMVGHLKLVPTIDEEALGGLILRVAKHPDDLEARLMLAAGYVQRGDSVDAGTQFRAIRDLDPENGQALLLRARLAMQRKDPKLARDLLETGFGRGGDDFDSRMMLAGLLLEAGRRDAAIAQLDGAIACWPTCPVPGQGSPFLAKARLLAEAGDRDGAAALMQRYLALNGRDYDVHLQLARYHKERGEDKEELSHLERARDVDPFDRELHERMAEVYHQQGRMVEAVRSLKLALAIRKEKDRGRQQAGDGEVEGDVVFEARVRTRLAEMLGDAGNTAEARKQAKRVLELGDEVPAGSALAPRPCSAADPAARAGPAPVP